MVVVWKFHRAFPELANLQFSVDWKNTDFQKVEAEVKTLLLTKTIALTIDLNLTV